MRSPTTVHTQIQPSEIVPGSCFLRMISHNPPIIILSLNRVVMHLMTMGNTMVLQKVCSLNTYIVEKRIFTILTYIMDDSFSYIIKVICLWDNIFPLGGYTSFMLVLYVCWSVFLFLEIDNVLVSIVNCSVNMRWDHHFQRSSYFGDRIVYYFAIHLSSYFDNTSTRTIPDTPLIFHFVSLHIFLLIKTTTKNQLGTE